MKSFIKINGKRSLMIANVIGLFNGNSHLTTDEIKSKLLSKKAKWVINSSSISGILSMYPFFKSSGIAMKSDYRDSGSYEINTWSLDLDLLVKRYKAEPKSGQRWMFFVDKTNQKITPVSKSNYNSFLLEVNDGKKEE